MLSSNTALMGRDMLCGQAGTPGRLSRRVLAGSGQKHQGEVLGSTAGEPCSPAIFTASANVYYSLTTSQALFQLVWGKKISGQKRP